MNLPLSLHVVVDQSPLFHKSMHTHDGTNIASKVAPAGCDREVLVGGQTKAINHEVAIGKVAV